MNRIWVKLAVSWGLAIAWGFTVARYDWPLILIGLAFFFPHGYTIIFGGKQ